MIFNSFGTVSPSNGAECPAGGSWESWCDCMWDHTSSEGARILNNKCRSQPLGPLSGAPWTYAGALLRGIPFSGTMDIPKIIPGTPSINSSSQPQMTVASTSSFFSMPMVAAGVAGLGLVAFLAKRKGKRKGRR